MNVNVDIQQLTNCSNTSVVDKVNEVVGRLNSLKVLEVGAEDGTKCLVKNIKNFSCKLTVITENKSILIFAITSDGITSELNKIRPIFIESITNEFKTTNAGDFIYLSKDPNDNDRVDLRLKYKNACIVIFDGIAGEYESILPAASLGDYTKIIGSQPSDWANYVPSDVIRLDDVDNTQQSPFSGSNWVSVEPSYSNDGKKFSYRIQLDKTELSSIIKTIQANITSIEGEIGNRTDSPSSASDSTIWSNINNLYYLLDALNSTVNTLTETTIPNLENALIGLGERLDGDEATIGQHTLDIQANTDDIGELKSRVDAIYDDVTDPQNPTGVLQTAIEDIEDHDIRIKALEDQELPEIHSSYQVDVSSEGYTCIGMFRPLSSYKSSAQFEVISELGDRIQFIVGYGSSSSAKYIKLTHLTNKSYTYQDLNGHDSTNTPIIVCDSYSEGTINYIKVYLKRLASNTSVTVSVNVLNFTYSELADIPNPAETISYSDLSNNAVTFGGCDNDESLSNIVPLIEYTDPGSSPGAIEDHVVYRGPSVAPKHTRVISLPNPTLTLSDKAKAVNVRDTTFNANSPNTSVDILSEVVKDANDSGLSGDGTSDNPLKVEADDVIFDPQYFSVLPDTQDPDKTVISLLSAPSGVLSISIAYANGSSGVTPPATGWEDPQHAPGPTPGGYYWTRMDIRLANAPNTPIYAYAVSRQPEINVIRMDDHIPSTYDSNTLYLI